MQTEKIVVLRQVSEEPNDKHWFPADWPYLQRIFQFTLLNTSY